MLRVAVVGMTCVQLSSLVSLPLPMVFHSV